MTSLASRTASLLVVIVAGLSLLNSAWLLPRARRIKYASSDMTDRKMAIAHARSTLRQLGILDLAYLDEEHSLLSIEASGEFNAVQYALAPVVLHRESTEYRIALVNFRISKRPRALPGLTFIENLGDGLAIYRRP